MQSFEDFSAISDMSWGITNVSQGEENAPTAPLPYAPDYRGINACSGVQEEITHIAIKRRAGGTTLCPSR
jgi:hypothetical protein